MPAAWSLWRASLDCLCRMTTPAPELGAKRFGADYLRALRAEHGSKAVREIRNRVSAALRKSGRSRSNGEMPKRPGPEGRRGPAGGTGADLRAAHDARDEDGERRNGAVRLGTPIPTSPSSDSPTSSKKTLRSRWMR